MTLVFGLIVTVQGFETSRYLSRTYDAPTRIQSMRIAQWVSGVIYTIYVVLLTYSFAADTVPYSETAIIDLMHQVAWILPPLLVVAALRWRTPVAPAVWYMSLVADVFALYYALQADIAAMALRQQKRPVAAMAAVGLALGALAMAAFGHAVEV